MMSFASHPYAAASSSSPLKRTSRAAKRPSLSARPISYLPDLEEEDDGVSRTFLDTDSPLGKLANLSLLDKASKRVSKPRPVGLNGTERMSLQMFFETGPSSYAQQSPVDTVNIDGLSLDFPRPPLTVSPSPSVSTSPSTPGMPLTPSSSDSEHETFEKAIKPLLIASKSSSPATPERKTKSKSTLARHDTATRRVFAPLDTVAANKLSLGLDPELELSLTGMLEEMRERKAGGGKVENVVDDDDESAWIDEEEDEFAGHDYYRADIATHIDIFSSPLSPSSSQFSPRSSLRRHASNSSSRSVSGTNYFPPARPDSMPPPPHFAKASAPISSFRRTSASSLASTVSASSVRSNGSRTSKGTKRTSNRVRASIARSRARRSSVSMKPSANTGKDLPPTPHTANTNFGPSSLLDPSYPRRRPSFTPPARTPPPPPPSAFRMAKRSTRPPPRSSLPVDIDFGAEDDDLVDFVDPFQDGFVEIVHPDDVPSKEDPVSPLDGASLPFSPSSLSLDLGAPSILQSDCSPAPDDTISFLSSDPYDRQSTITGGSNNDDDEYNEFDEYAPNRALRSRWSMSTLGSIEPAPASSARSLFPAIPKLFQSSRSPKKEKEPKEPKPPKAKKAQRESSSQSTEPRGFPFFPTPTPPSPKRKTTLGPGPFKYSGPPSSTAPSSASPSKSSFISTAPSSPAPSPNAKTCHSPSPSASSSAQYVSYTPHHTKQKASMGGAATPASSDAQSSFSFALSASSSTHRFLPGNGGGSHSHSPSPSPSRGLRRSNSRASTNSDMSGTSRGSCESGSSTGSSGLRRKPIPIEIFLR